MEELILPGSLSRNNIDEVFKNYLQAVSELPSKLEEKTPLSLLESIKRKEVKVGPYPGVTFFEAANRIMTDLVILQGIKALFHGAIPEIDFDKYLVELGHSDKADHDIMATRDGQTLRGEVFNVAQSFFPIKKYNSLNKLRTKSSHDDIILLMYNADAVEPNYRPKNRDNEFHLRVDLKHIY